MNFKFLMAVLFATSSLTAFAKININTATVDELVLLNGLGENKAKAIIAYRDENGQFKDINELTKVKGIGAKTIAKLAEDLTVTEVTDLSNIKNRTKAQSKLNSSTEDKSEKEKTSEEKYESKKSGKQTEKSSQKTENKAK